ncbi:hypothetical protein GAMM_110027 [Gammaproteobacteria bacterium]
MSQVEHEYYNFNSDNLDVFNDSVAFSFGNIFITPAEPGRAKRWREARGSRRERAAFASEDRRRPVIVAFPSRRTSAATQTVTLILALW